METNLGLEFNKRVYLNLKKEPLQNLQYRHDNMQLHETLIKTKLSDLMPKQLNLKDKIGDSYEYFSLITSGLGLLIGTGNEHGTGSKVKERKMLNGYEKIDEVESHEFKMGFHFDHSTGIPVITGHNLKGRIRSFFPIAYKIENKKNAIGERLLDDLINCFQEDKTLEVNTWDITKIQYLENIIFEGKIDEVHRINSLKQDTFLGAYPSKSYSKEYSFTIPEKYIDNGKPKFKESKPVVIPSGTFLFDDTLAHHPHPLKDPMPISLLKILPDVEITFQFKLNDEGGLSGKQKAKLFEYLLKKYGAGAKTSSGYGQFKKEITPSKEKGYLHVKDEFKPINIQYIETNNNINIHLISESERINNIQKQLENQRIQNIEKKNLLENTIVQIQKMLKTNTSYNANVIHVDFEKNKYRIKLNDYEITLERELSKEAKKGIAISEKMSIVIVFFSLKEPLNYRVNLPE